MSIENSVYLVRLSKENYFGLRLTLKSMSAPSSFIFGPVTGAGGLGVLALHRHRVIPRAASAGVPNFLSTPSTCAVCPVPPIRACPNRPGRTHAAYTDYDGLQRVHSHAPAM
jgi:hypothetical protein